MLNTFLFAAEYAKEQTLLENVNQIKKLSEKNNYLVSFMGQFSSGKSRLLNNLIEREILPVHATETTPIVTLIRYGVEEKALIRYCDGRERDIAVEEVAAIWQDSNMAEEYGLPDIIDIEICLNVEMLKNGLVLADTPGINTVINSHEEVTTKLLANTEELFFVTSKSVTDSDMVFMKLVNGIGIKTSVVRTHMDEIKESEEDIDVTMAADIEKYNNLIGKECDCYFISNEPDSKWYMGVVQLRTYLEDQLANTVRENIAASCELRMSKLTEKLKKSVSDKLEMLVAKQEGRRNELEIELERNKAAIQRISDMFSKKEESIKHNIDALRRESEENLQETKRAAFKESSNQLSEIDYSDDMYEEMQHISISFLESANIKIREAYFAPFDREISTINDQIYNNNDVSEIFTAMPKIASVNDIIDQSRQQDIRLREYQNQLINRKNFLEKNKFSVDNSGTDYEEEIKALQEEMNSVDQLLAEHGKYSPHYIEVPGDNTVSEGLAKVGQFLDIATLFIPAPTPGKIATVTKAGGLLSKVRTFFKGAKVVKDVEKVAKTVSILGKVKKGADLLRNVRGKADEHGVLDLVTLEYWGRKIGSKFDTPPQKIEDVEYRDQFMAEKRSYEHQRMRIMNAMIEKKRAAGLFKSRQEEEAARRRAQQEEMQKIESYMQRRQIEIEAEAKKKYVTKVRNEWCRWTEKQLDIICDNLKRNSAPIFNQAMGDYRKMVLGSMEEKHSELEAKESEISAELSSLSANGIQQEIDTGRKLLNELRSA